MFLAAVNTQQKIGIAITALVVLGWLVYVFAYLRRPETPPPGSEIELAPNRRPYLDDEGLEGPRLGTALGWALALLVVSALGLPLYWLNEPGRQAGAERGFDERAAHRGFILFQPADSPVPAGNVGHFGCGGCHGSEGQGGAAQYSISDPLDPSKPPRQVQWAAPPLDTVTLRYNDDEIRRILVYGRPNTPMPAWGVLGGGPMNDQQINDLVAYLHKIAKKPKDVQAEAMKQYGVDGRALFDGFCARCHTKGWTINEPEAPGGGAFGPNLTNGITLRQFPNPADHEEFIAQGSDFEKPYGVRGVGTGRMPGFGQELTPEQIKAIVEYERSL